MENKLKHTKGGVTRLNFSRDFSRNGVALKVDETCYTSQLSQNSSFCAKSFWNHFKNSQRVAELNIARKVGNCSMLHGTQLLTQRRCLRAARWTLKRYHNTSSVSSMLLDLGWRSLEQRRADSRLTLLYNIHKGHVPIEASKHIQPMKRRSSHSHSNSFIPISTSSSSHRCRSTRELLLNGTVFPSLFLITMTLLLLNIPSLLSVTILSTNYFSYLFIV